MILNYLYKSTLQQMRIQLINVDLQFFDFLLEVLPQVLHQRRQISAFLISRRLIESFIAIILLKPSRVRCSRRSIFHQLIFIVHNPLVFEFVICISWRGSPFRGPQVSRAVRWRGPPPKLKNLIILPKSFNDSTLNYRDYGPCL